MQHHTNKTIDEFEENEEEIIPIDHSIEYTSPPISKKEATRIKETHKGFTPDVLKTIENLEKKSKYQTDATFANLYKYNSDLLLVFFLLALFFFA